MIIYRKLYRFVVSALVLSIILSGVICIPAVAQENTLNKVYCTATLEDEFDDNKVIIVIHPQYNNRAYGISDFNEINCIEIKDRSVNVKEGKPSRILTLTLAVNSKENVLDAIQILERRNDIYSAEPSYTMSPCTIPNDEKYVSGKQWAINKISMPDAWGETTGSSEILVGVIDSGIDGTHPDLANRINTELSQGFNDYSSNPLIDNLGHGTKVAGIIGAEGDNTEGMVGVCWNVQLISLRVAKSDGDFDGDAILAAIQYAELHNIPILNYSGGSSANSFRTAIETYSGLFVCAAGNEKQNNDETAHYPSNNNNLPNVISVGASTEEDTKHSSSNYGATKVDLFAPGEDVLTTVIGSRKYAESGGTSIAAPYVTGVAALILSKYPTMNAAHIKYSILANVDIVYDSDGESVFSTLCKSGGRLNAYAALENAQTDHIFAGSSIGEEGHTKICTICNYIGETVAHTLHYFNNGVDSDHTVDCSGCDYEYTEFHTWETIGLKFRCTKCGVTSTQVPVLPFALSPEILAKIEQMGYVSDFAMDIGDGTVLCRVDDQYYLVRGQTEATTLSYLQNELSVILPDTEAA